MFCVYHAHFRGEKTALRPQNRSAGNRTLRFKPHPSLFFRGEGMGCRVRAKCARESVSTTREACTFGCRRVSTTRVPPGTAPGPTAGVWSRPGSWLSGALSMGLSFPIPEMGTAGRTSQGRGQAFSGSTSNAELYILAAAALAHCGGSSPVSTRVRVRRRRPIVQEGGEAPESGFPAPGRPRRPVEQTTWLQRLPRGARPLSAPRRPMPAARAPLLWQTKPGLPRARRAGEGLAPPSSRLNTAPSPRRPLIGPRGYKEAGKRADHVGQRGLP